MRQAAVAKKRLAIDADLALATMYALVTAAVSFTGLGFITTALGLGLVAIVPGYALIAALFPGRGDIGAMSRAALSFGLSLLAAPLAGLALYFSPWGFSPGALYVCLAALTVACAIVAGKRRNGLAPESRFRAGLRKAIALPAGTGLLNRALVAVLALAILLSASVIVYVILAPAPGEKFTEFYLLGPDGKAYDYPVSFRPGETKPVIVGVVNHEYRDVTYGLAVTLNDSVNVTGLHEESVTLAHGQTWQQTIELKPDMTGTGMKLEFLLYADGNRTAPYRDLRLWIDVLPPLF